MADFVMNSFIYDYLPPLAGLLVGLWFGGVCARERSCLLGAISDRVLMKKNDRLIFWIIAALSALTITSALRMLNFIDLSDTYHLVLPVTIFPAVIGGSLFGAGMVFATGCIAKNLVRMGSGCIKSFIVVVFTVLSARLIMSGQLTFLREWLNSLVTLPVPSQPLDLPFLLIISFILLISLLLFASKKTKHSAWYWISAISLGLAISLGWLATHCATHTIQPTDPLFFFFPEKPAVPESLSFGQSIVWCSDWLLLAKPMDRFGITAVLGTILGAAFVYKKAGVFMVTSFHDTKDLLFHLLGALLMGVGATLAGGCSIGQGFTGLSTGSLSSLIAIVFMAISASVTLHIQLNRSTSKPALVIF